MKKGIWTAVIVVIVILLIGSAISDRKTTTGNGERPIKIGGLFELSGFAAFTAEDSRDGFLMAIEDSGLDLEYIIEDGHSDITDTITAANKLVNINKVDVVVGPEWNEFGEAISDIAESSQIAFVSPWATSEAEWAKNPYYFSMTPSERVHHQAVVEHMEENGVVTVALVYTNNAWSLENISIFKDVLSKSTIKVVGEYKFNPDQRDFQTDIIKIKESNPDAIFLPIAAGNQTGPFLKRFVELGLKSKLYAPESVGQDNTVRGDFGRYTEGLIFYRSVKYKKSDEFVAKFEKKYGRQPTTRTASTAYDTVMIIAEAVKSGARTSQEIAQHIMNVKNYDGYSNLITFNERGQLETEGVELVQIQGGENVIVK